MAEKYYFDTCIWRDHYESRRGPQGRPLGDYASKLFMKVIRNKDLLFYSDFVIKELMIKYTKNEVNDMLNILFLSKVIQRLDISEKEMTEAVMLSKERGVPRGDALHAILARNNKAILITQDMKDYNKLRDIATIKRPEEIL